MAERIRTSASWSRTPCKLDVQVSSLNCAFPLVPCFDDQGPEEYLVAMLRKRSVPADIVLPHGTYKKLAEALDFLAAHSGFVDRYRYVYPIHGTQLHLGHPCITVNVCVPG